MHNKANTVICGMINNLINISDERSCDLTDARIVNSKSLLEGEMGFADALIYEAFGLILRASRFASRSNIFSIKSL